MADNINLEQIDHATLTSLYKGVMQTCIYFCVSDEILSETIAQIIRSRQLMNDYDLDLMQLYFGHKEC